MIDPVIYADYLLYGDKSCCMGQIVTSNQINLTHRQTVHI